MTGPEEFLMQIRKGHEARDELYRETRADLLPVLERLLPPAMSARWDAEDLFHESFLRAVAHLDRFEWRHEGSWRGYVLQIAKNLIRDVLKRSSWPNVRLEQGERDGGLRASKVPGRDPSASSLLREQEFVETVFRDMRPGDVHLLQLKLLEGLDDGEIAERVDKSVAAVRKALTRAKARFAEIAAELDVD